MSLTPTSLLNRFVAEVTGFGELPISEADGSLLRDTLRTHPVVVIRGARLTPDRQVELTELLGDVEPASDMRNHHPESVRVMVVHNSGDTPIVGNQCWHSDRSFLPAPTRYTVLYGQTIPENAGDTIFADMVAAYDQAPARWKSELTHATGIHSYDKLARMRAEIHRAPIQHDYQTEYPPVRHPLVRVHPETGDLALFISELCLTALHGHDAPGLSIEGLLAHATADRFVHRHRWRPGDIVMWDNIRVLHRAAALPPGTTRVLYRTTTAGTPPIPPRGWRPHR